MRITSVPLFLPSIVAATALTLGSSAFTPANAYSVSPTGAITLSAGTDRKIDSMKWLVPTSTTGLSSDLSARADVHVKVTDTFVNLSIELFNTTASSLQAAITSFGLAIDPGATSVDLFGGQVFNKAILQTDPNQNFPGGFKGIDIRVLATSQQCSGGARPDGLQAGRFDKFTLQIGGNFSNGVTIASYPMKFQTQGGSFEAAGVPEPITVVGSGLALGFGALFKREISKKRSKDKVKA